MISMNKERNFLNMLKILLYVMFSSCGLILLKIGTSKNFSISFNKGSFSLEINFVLITGFLLYIASFITSLIVMQGMNLNIFYPVSAGAIYIIVCVLSTIVLHEEISIKQLVGMCIILIGILIINIKN